MRPWLLAFMLFLAACAGSRGPAPPSDGSSQDGDGSSWFPDLWTARDLGAPEETGVDGPVSDQYPVGDLGNLTQILLVALDQAHTGNLGGVKGADALCQAEAKAAGRAGLFRAFLSDAAQNVADIVGGPNAALPVVNTKGQLMFQSWQKITTTKEWTNGVMLYTFSGVAVDDNTGGWYDGRLWTGSKLDGTVYAGHTCQDWSSASGALQGRNGEADQRELLRDNSTDCDRSLAVVCVRLVP